MVGSGCQSRKSIYSYSRNNNIPNKKRIEERSKFYKILLRNILLLLFFYPLSVFHSKQMEKGSPD